MVFGAFEVRFRLSNTWRKRSVLAKDDQEEGSMVESKNVMLCTKIDFARWMLSYGTGLYSNAMFG